MTSEMSTAATISASVCMLASHSPVSPINSRHSVVSRPSRRPPNLLPSRNKLATMTGQGSHSKNASERRITKSTKALIGSKK